MSLCFSHPRSHFAALSLSELLPSPHAVRSGSSSSLSCFLTPQPLLPAPCSLSPGILGQEGEPQRTATTRAEGRAAVGRWLCALFAQVGARRGGHEACGSNVGSAPCSGTSLFPPSIPTGSFSTALLPAHASRCGEEDSDAEVELLSSASSPVPCPICGLCFTAAEVERHCSTCGE